MKWLTGSVLATAARRLVPLFLAGLIALLGDAGLLDGQIVEALQVVLSGS